MKRGFLKRSIGVAVSFVSVISLASCEEKVPDRGEYKEEQSSTPTQAPAPTQEAEPETPTPAETPQAGPVRLSAAEIKNINDNIAVDYNGFFLCDYCCPEMIDWGTVLYNGAGISRDLTDEEYDNFTSEYGEVMTGITAIDEDALNDYIKKTTGTDLAHSLIGLDWSYLYMYRVYCSAHGDTNYMPITVTGGEKDGNIYTIEYYKWDSIISDDKFYLLTAEVKDNGDWMFISNLPKDDPTQAVLLDMEFYPEAEDIYAFDPVDVYTVEMLDSDEPGNSWCLITARQDYTYITINRADISGDNETLIWDGIFLPGEELYTVCLDAGASIGINTNLPWNPRIHMRVESQGFEAEYWFGEDNWRHNYNEFGIQDGVLIVGHNKQAEGRGLQPQNTIQFLNMLNGGWILYDKHGEVHYTFGFNEGDLEIKSGDEYFELLANSACIDVVDADVPDGIALKMYDDIPKDKLGNYDADKNTYYKVKVEDTGDEWIFTLTAADAGRDILGLLLEDCGNNGVYELHRYK